MIFIGQDLAGSLLDASVREHADLLRNMAPCPRSVDALELGPKKSSSLYYALGNHF